MLKWTVWTAIGLLCLHFGALFVGLGSIRLEYYDILYNHACIVCSCCAMFLKELVMTDQHSMVAGQVTLWSDKVLAVVKVIFFPGLLALVLSRTFFSLP